MHDASFGEQFTSIEDACALAQGIVNTVREPVLVLDSALRVIAASRSFYSRFQVDPEETVGRLLYALGDGQWDVPRLRTLLENIIPEQGRMENYEVEQDFPALGRRTMCLNACQVFHRSGANATILLSMEDITEQLAMERQLKALIREKEIMLDELEHRIANSLQIVASIILMKAREVTSEETRQHLQDAHRRVISVAAVQKQLHPSGPGGEIEMTPYLSRLCETLATSMIGDARPISLKVVGGKGTETSRQAEIIGLVATELVMNALKHAFPEDDDAGRIVIDYEKSGTNWKFSVTDNGVGLPDGVFAQKKTGLGTGIVKALAQQLDAVVKTVADADGTSVTVTHATFSSAPEERRKADKVNAAMPAGNALGHSVASVGTIA